MAAEFPSVSNLLDGVIAVPIGPEKDRVFNPANDPKYATSVPVPYGLTFFSPQLSVTFLTFGDKYNPTKSELKAARNIIRRAGIPTPGLDVPAYPLADTMVIELATNIHEGFVATVRWYGHWSGYNRWEDETRTLPGLVKWIKRVIFQTDSDDLIQAATKFWEWHDGGFPKVFPIGITEAHYVLLNRDIECLEAVNGGIEVLFWKVPREYLPGAWHQTEVQLGTANGPFDDGTVCHCRRCMVAQQMQEHMFALTGNPCYPNAKLVAKYGHLKVGETFPLTNNAGVDAKVTMQVDGSVAAQALKEIEGKALKKIDGNATMGTKSKQRCEFH